MPLIYNSLDSEHPEVQEKALKVIPTLLDVLDVSTVQDVLFVKTAQVFVKTRALSGQFKIFSSTPRWTCCASLPKCRVILM